ncbi:MAG: cytochrome c, partial [Gammaproteobacteria bacterium]|nr:cytochrome c [Gammaproteobacteria bacterium]
MNRYSKTLVFICLLLAGLMSWQQRAVASNTGISAEDIASIDDARDLYQSNCAACHGFDGVPIMAGVPNFGKNERMEKTDQELLASIKNGKIPESGGVAMPPWNA